MPPNKAALKKAGEKGRAVAAVKQAIMKETNSSEQLLARLTHAQMQIADLEALLSQQKADYSALEIKLNKSQEYCSNLKQELAIWKEKHRIVYHDVRMLRQSTKRTSSQHNDLEEQVKLLKSAQVTAATEARDSARAMGSLIKVNNELSHSIANWKSQIEFMKSKFNLQKTELQTSKKKVIQLQKTCRRAVKVKENAVFAATRKVAMTWTQYHLQKKGVFTEETRNIVRLLIKAGCSAKYINEVIQTILQTAGIKTVGTISRTTVSRVIREGFIAAQIQLGHEMKMTNSMTFSADGTSHRSVNYNSRHVHLLVEDYSSPESSLPTERVTRFLGIRSSKDGTSQEAVADWQKTMSDIVDLYNRSPFGKRSGGLIRLVDLFVKLAGMNSDHCAKEKKDAALLKEIKEKAVYQSLGEDVLLEKTSAEINLIYSQAEEAMIKKAGGPRKWKLLTPDAQAEQKAAMVETVIADLGKDALEMLSDHEKRTLRLFIWAGCGCHKDLNTVKGGYTTMSQWWAKNKVKGPILLANRDNSPVVDEMNAALEQGNTPTLAQERAFEKSTRGAIKTAEIAGAIFNHKDDKKGHHDLFCWWWFEHVGIPFTFPDTSNNRFQSYCDAAAVLLLYTPQFIQFLQHLRDNKKSGLFNHMEANLWKALHDEPTMAEFAVLALYAESISYPYMKAIRTCRDTKQNVLDLGPLHHRVHSHMLKIINNPEILIGPDSTHENASLDGEEWQNPLVVKKVLEMIPSLPYFCDLLLSFFNGSAHTWVRFISEFAPGGLIDEATVEEKELAWMPTTNDENEGALGSFRLLMRLQPQLSLLSHNAMTMFFRNNTQAFMEAKFTEKEDFEFLHKMGRVSAGEEKKRKKELIQHRDAIQAKKVANRQKRQQKKQERKDMIAQTPIITDKNLLMNLKGKALHDMLQIFKTYGAPNLAQINQKTKVALIRQSLVDAIDLADEGKWSTNIQFSSEDDSNTQSGEEFNWEDIDEEQEEDI